MKIQSEIWKDIPEYKGMYQASNLGRVRSLDRKYRGSNQFGASFIVTKKGKILKPKVRKDGYLSVVLYNKQKTKHISVHRLIALTFLPNPNNYAVINHKDEDKTNNNVSNLEWCTQSYNINYGSRNEKTAEKLRNIIKDKKWCENISKGKKGKTMSFEFREAQRKASLKRKRNALGQFLKKEG